MAYRRNYRQARPQVRSIVVKYSAPCACCGATIQAGESASYYPPGTIAGRTVGAIAHFGGLEGNGVRCFHEMRKRMTGDAAVNDYAGDGLDERYEDQCRDICGN